MGPIGFAAVISSVCRGWPVTMYGRDDENSFRANLARSFGAKYLTATNINFVPDVVEQDGFDLLLECAGSNEVAATSADFLASCGVFVWLGSSRIPKPRPHNLSLLMRNAILRNYVFLGSVNAAPRDFADALRHLARMQTGHPSEINRLITDRVPPAESLWHYKHRRPQGIKTVLIYDSAS